MWSAADLEAKQGLIQARAYQHWRRYAWTMDRTFLADLEQEAWAAALAYAPDEPLLAVKIDDRLRAYLRYWRLGLRSVGSTTAPRAIYQQVPMVRQAVQATWQSHAPLGPEPTMVLRDILQMIWDRCTPRQQQIWAAQALEGRVSLTREKARPPGLSDWQVSRARKGLQRIAAQVLKSSEERRT